MGSKENGFPLEREWLSNGHRETDEIIEYKRAGKQITDLRRIDLTFCYP
jgi:hypothetical protein